MKQQERARIVQTMLEIPGDQRRGFAAHCEAIAADGSLPIEPRMLALLLGLPMRALLDGRDPYLVLADW
jgi:hypothetical protein